jgi:hypothetical protein
MNHSAFPKEETKIDLVEFPVEYLYWTDLNKVIPSKPPLNNFSDKLANNREFIKCNHIKPYYIIDETNKFTAQNMQRYKYAERGVKAKNHFYGGIIPMCLNFSLAVGLDVRYVERVAHTCDLLIVAMEERENKTSPYDKDEFKHKRIAGFVCINLIRKNIFEVEIICSRTNYSGVGGSLLKTLCEHGRRVGLKYCWLNSVPNAVTFYLKMGFVYAGHIIEGNVKKGYMIYDLSNAKNGPHKIIVKQRNNSVNISEILKKGQPNTTTVELRDITEDKLDLIEDVNLYINILSRSDEARNTFKQYMVPITRNREVVGHYIRSGFFDKICPMSLRDPLHSMGSVVNPLLAANNRQSQSTNSSGPPPDWLFDVTGIERRSYRKNFTQRRKYASFPYPVVKTYRKNFTRRRQYPETPYPTSN